MKIISDLDFERKGSFLINKEEINSISEYLDYIHYVQQKWDQSELWYRGIPNCGHKLVPSIYRVSTWSYDERLAYNLFHDFVRYAKQMIFNGNYFSEWEWYQLQQHYGLPTRLLDWTEGFFIALFFAVRDVKPDISPCVWVLEPFQLNQISISQRSLLFTDKSLMDSDDQIVNDYLYDNNKLPPFPIAILPSHIDQRFKSQKSCFTIHGKYVDGFDQVFFKDKSNFKLMQSIISTSNLKSIKEELSFSGISEATLFPDLEGLARELKNKYCMN